MARKRGKRRRKDPCWIDITPTLKVRKLRRDEYIDVISGRVRRRRRKS